MKFNTVRSPRFAWMTALTIILALPAFAAGTSNDPFAGKPAAAADSSSKTTAVSCEQAAGALHRAPASARFALAYDVVSRPCKPVPAPVWSAIQSGKWDDDTSLQVEQRMGLLDRMVASRYAEAESLTVQLLESGFWPNQTPVNLLQGSQLVESLKPALTPYRIHLLLDIYEQRPASTIRLSVVRALRGAKDPAALLPALNACWVDTGSVQTEGLAVVAEQPEKVPEKLLVRLLNTLPESPVLHWAEDLAEKHSNPEVKAALKKRLMAHPRGAHKITR